MPSGFRSEFGHKFKTKKRSVYAPVFRNSPYEVLQVFDVANPNFVMGKRPNSNIPTQALFMLNSGFVADAAESAAKELLELPATDDSARIALAFRRVLGRPPSDVERQISLELLETERKAGADSIQQWITLHQGLFACVDFRYLR